MCSVKLDEYTTFSLKILTATLKVGRLSQGKYKRHNYINENFLNRAPCQHLSRGGWGGGGVTIHIMN